MVDKVIADSPKQLEQYRGGKTKLQGYFAGQVCFHSVLGVCCFHIMLAIDHYFSHCCADCQVMKESKGKANPKLLNKILLEKLNAKS